MLAGSQRRPWWLLGLLALALLAGPNLAFAQNGDDGDDTIGGEGVSGVAIDAEGVLRHQTFADPSGMLTRQRFEQARAALDQEMARPSELRKVSLTRLERAIAKQQAAGRQPTDAMLHLAGLTRLRYVFFYPETNDIVLAGPAEGWGRDLTGRVVGLDSGAPVLELRDLVVALRAFPPGGKPKGPIYCSIDPTQEGLAKMQQFLQQVGGHATPAHTQFIVQGLRDSLGLQVITIGGISPKTHFAQVMVEADYRMKLIGIGLERPPVEIVSYVSRANPAMVARNAMQRWYFVPDYQCVRVADDHLAMELVGDGVKLVSEEELVTQDGNRRTTGQQSRASALFTRTFTEKYPALAQKSPVYAQLRNCIDMLVAAAYMQKQDYYQQAGWSMELLGSEQRFPVEVENAPERVATAVNSIWKGNRLMTPIGGGVEIAAWKALADDALLADSEGKVDALRDQLDLKSLPEDQWWWD